MAPKRGGIVKITKAKKTTQKMITSKPELAASIPDAQNSGEDLSKRPVYFWREYNHAYGFMSQWYHAPFSDPKVPSITYQTAEQYMMYHKALLFSDPVTGAKILETHNPKEQKHLGRQVKNFDEDVWVKNRMRIVEEGTYLKFKYGGKGEQAGDEGSNRSLRERLIGTGERKLVEASPFDKIWGIGLREKQADGKKDKWGLNLLGICLMRARERLAAEVEEEVSSIGEVVLESETEKA